MNIITLTNSIGQLRIDQIMRGVVGIYELTFPDRIRCSYLIGSYTDGSAVPLSDLDIRIIFKNDFCNSQEKEIAEQAAHYCMLMSPVRLDVGSHSEHALVHEHVIKTAIKLGGILLYGKDIRGSILLPTMEVYTRDLTEGALVFLTRVLRGADCVTFPLTYPDPQGIFYGYDHKRIAIYYPTSIQQGIKELVTSIMWVSSALIALKARKYVGKKDESVKLYRDCINDEWTPFIETLYASGKLQWRYLIPEDTADRALLRTLCKETLAFENHYLTLYRDYLLALLRIGDDAMALFAAQRLRTVVYPDEVTIAALQARDSGDFEELHIAVQEAIRQIQCARNEVRYQGRKEAD